MLKTRLTTAVFLLAVLVPALFWLPAPEFAAFTLIIAVVAAWEFARLLGQDPAGQWRFASIIAVAGAGIGSQLPSLTGLGIAGPAERPILLLAFGLASAFWLLVCPFWLRQRWRLHDQPRGWGILLGWLVIVPTWLAMLALRQQGAMTLLGVMAVAWVADVAAYFSGRAFGTTKLAPEISPGKTTAGAYGAAVAVTVYALSVAAIGGRAWGGESLWVILGALVLTAVSIWGDLLESLLKRQTGLKDSSSLLPGHGGVMDRIDSLTAVLPVAALALMLFSF